MWLAPSLVFAPSALRKLPEALGKLRAKGRGEIGDETRAPPFFPKLPQDFRKLPQGLWKLPEALRKTCGLLKLRGSGRKGQGPGKEGVRGTSMSAVEGVFSSACRAASQWGILWEQNTLTLLQHSNSSAIACLKAGGDNGGGYAFLTNSSPDHQNAS